MRMHPPLLAVLNMIFCGYMDQYIRKDRGGSFLALFLFIEVSLVVLAELSFLVRGGDIIRKTTIFPTTPLSRILFTVWGSIRRPASIALWSTALFFMIVLRFPSWPLSTAAVAATFLLIADAELIIGILSLWITRSSLPMTSLGVVVILGITAALILSVVFGQAALLSSVPILSFSVNAMAGAETGDLSRCFLSCGLLVATGMAAIALGRKIA